MFEQIEAILLSWIKLRLFHYFLFLGHDVGQPFGEGFDLCLELLVLVFVLEEHFLESQFLAIAFFFVVVCCIVFWFLHRFNILLSVPKAVSDTQSI